MNQQETYTGSIDQGHETSSYRASINYLFENQSGDYTQQEHGEIQCLQGRFENHALENRHAAVERTVKEEQPAQDEPLPIPELESEGAYFCGNCERELLPDQPRIHCNDCEDYDSCANCHLSGRMSGSHTFAHRFEIVQPSSLEIGSMGRKPTTVAVSTSSVSDDQSILSLQTERDLSSTAKKIRAMTIETNKKDHKEQGATSQDSPTSVLFKAFEDAWPQDPGGAKKRKVYVTPKAKIRPVKTPTSNYQSATQNSANGVTSAVPLKPSADRVSNAAPQAWESPDHPDADYINHKPSKTGPSAPRDASDALFDYQPLPSSHTSSQWTWITREDDRGKDLIISDLGMKLIDTIFTYVDNMFEPFGAGELSPEKFLHARSFWMEPKQKKDLFSKTVTTENFYDAENVRDWTGLSVLLDQMGIQHRKEQKLYQLPGTFEDRKRPDYYMKIPYISRAGLKEFYRKSMAEYPDKFFQETCSILDAIPSRSRRDLPAGKPQREHFAVNQETCVELEDQVNFRSKYGRLWTLLLQIVLKDSLALTNES